MCTDRQLAWRMTTPLCCPCNEPPSCRRRRPARCSTHEACPCAHTAQRPALLPACGTQRVHAHTQRSSPFSGKWAARAELTASGTPPMSTRPSRCTWPPQKPPPMSRIWGEGLQELQEWDARRWGVQNGGRVEARPEGRGGAGTAAAVGASLLRAATRHVPSPDPQRSPKAQGPHLHVAAVGHSKVPRPARQLDCVREGGRVGGARTDVECDARHLHTHAAGRHQQGLPLVHLGAVLQIRRAGQAGTAA